MNTQLLLALGVAGGGTALDTLLGVLLALKQGTFSWQKFPNWLPSMLLPYLTPMSVATFFQSVVNGTAATVVGGITYAGIGMFATKLIQDIYAKVTALLAPAPAAAKK